MCRRANPCNFGIKPYKDDKKPLILITNDDSISAPGIKVLTEIANDFGEVWVVALMDR